MYVDNRPHVRLLKSKQDPPQELPDRARHDKRRCSGPKSRGMSTFECAPGTARCLDCGTVGYIKLLEES